MMPVRLLLLLLLLFLLQRAELDLVCFPIETAGLLNIVICGIGSSGKAMRTAELVGRSQR
jgi:hypothetical protein